jgi:transcriptional regulator with XRE-family HTH domain
MNVISKLIDLHGRGAVASRMGVSRAATYKWERERVCAERAVQIANEFDIPLWKIRPDLWSRPKRQTQNAA